MKCYGLWSVTMQGILQTTTSEGNYLPMLQMLLSSISLLKLHLNTPLQQSRPPLKEQTMDTEYLLSIEA